MYNREDCNAGSSLIGGTNHQIFTFLSHRKQSGLFTVFNIQRLRESLEPRRRRAVPRSWRYTVVSTNIWVHSKIPRIVWDGLISEIERASELARERERERVRLPVYNCPILLNQDCAGQLPRLEWYPNSDHGAVSGLHDRPRLVLPLHHKTSNAGSFRNRTAQTMSL